MTEYDAKAIERFAEHKPNQCCDFHAYIADGCCHCGDDLE